MRRRGYTPDWDPIRAGETFEMFRGKKLKRPNGSIVYEVVKVERIHCGHGIRIRRHRDDPGYVICLTSKQARRYPSWHIPASPPTGIRGQLSKPDGVRHCAMTGRMSSTAPCSMGCVSSSMSHCGVTSCLEPATATSLRTLPLTTSGASATVTEGGRDKTF